ncbi:sensor histidine kinase [Hymenobacter sp. BT683]|uniref:Sensor histidine kinase n=1 Tax=Hymenobacter jeongseonensis TaxID=2791027 RepID=A0ABS0II66_9BACT|nr:sensor histidine kinase [Hymenobacter jeongseonensis]MBF9238033.1 sensor histidine kinase [Hymenobacter jeongseonensis]
MKPLSSSAAADRPSRFPLVFEGMVWVLYVGLYKYALFMEAVPERSPDRANLPYPQLIAFALVATLYIVPYYRVAVPALLRRRRYLLLGLVAVGYSWVAIRLNMALAHGLFQHVAHPPLLADYYHRGYLEAAAQLLTRQQPYLGLLFTDVLAFSCVAFVQVAFEHETRRRRVEQDHSALQMEQLKAQLQPHFLFNTLNSIYGLSLAGSPETPRFILLLSDLMRYVLYDSGKPQIALAEEVSFLENYFELEQRKYAGARVAFRAVGAAEATDVLVPPLLLLPLVENSFKHGRHHFSDDASVEATLTTTPGRLHFLIENDLLPDAPAASPKRRGGIGLQNIRQRLHLYYPHAHELHLTEHNGRYRAELTLRL